MTLGERQSFIKAIEEQPEQHVEGWSLLSGEGAISEFPAGVVYDF